jgi:hypothetical protein
VFIIGDLQGGDKICCRSPTYSNSVGRLSRKCNVSGQDSGDPNVECHKISMVKVKALVESNNQEVLDKYNQYNVHSAWFDVDFGGCRFGIFSAAAPIEPLHSWEIGVIPDCLHILFDSPKKGGCMNTKQRSTLDGMVRRMSSW